MEPGPPLATVTDYAPAPVASGPVGERERITTLDVLRGIAVGGILMINIQTFAFPLFEGLGAKWWELPRIDGICKLTVDYLCLQKFITLFSLLFGMGLAIQMSRLSTADAGPTRRMIRRLAVLLLIGVMHGVLLWYGDILTLYAVLGFVALLFRNVLQRGLLKWAIVLMSVPLIATVSCAAIYPEADWDQQESWAAESESTRDESDAEQEGPTTQGGPAQSRPSGSTTASAGPDVEKLIEKMGEFLEDESRIYRSGTWGEMTLHRTVYYVLFFLEELFLNTGWRSLSLFLIGMYFMRRSVFDGSPENDQLIRNLVLWGLGLGVPLQTLAFYLEWYEHSKAWSVATHRVLLDVSTLGIALGYMGLVAMACRRVRWRRRLEPFAAAGRMAFTNYLSQSVIGGLIFYSYGLALFDTLRWPAVFAIALAIYGAQLIVSPIWLRNFQFGPAEWSWRSLTYGKAPPFVRPGPLGNGS